MRFAYRIEKSVNKIISVLYNSLYKIGMVQYYIFYSLQTNELTAI